MSKYLCHIVNIACDVLILYWQVDPTLLSIFAETQ